MWVGVSGLGVKVGVKVVLLRLQTTPRRPRGGYLRVTPVYLPALGLAWLPPGTTRLPVACARGVSA